MSASLQIKRIQIEQKEIEQNPSDIFYANPMEDNMFVWHFTLLGPKDSSYENGLYHGKIELSQQYPLKPPDLYFLNPNGRFEVNEKICLNFTKFHRENWNPSFTIRMLLEAITHHFPIEDVVAGVGSLHYKEDERKLLASVSYKWKCDKCGQLSDIFQNKFKKNTINEKVEEKKQEQTENNSEEVIMQTMQTIKTEEQNDDLQKVVLEEKNQISQELKAFKIQKIIQDKSQQGYQDLQQQKANNFLQMKYDSKQDIIFKEYLKRHLECFYSLKTIQIDQLKQKVRESKPKQVQQIQQKEQAYMLLLNSLILFCIILLIIYFIY